MTFEEWCDELDKIGREKYDMCFDYTIHTGREHWKDIYLDGTSPQESIDEDFTYGD